MKTTFLLALLASATLGYAQTTPSTTSTGSSAAASGTKNVGSDRADAPQAPGMQSATPAGGARATGRRSAKKSKAGSAMPKQ